MIARSDAFNVVCHPELVEGPRAGRIAPESRGAMIDAKRLRNLQSSPAVTEDALLSEERVLARHGRYTVFYGPFESVPSQSVRLIIVGLTPGYTQLKLANSSSPAERRGRASFAGAMRNNLVAMMDQIGLAEALSLETTRQLFFDRGELLFATSALRYPVFVGGELRNFGGSQSMMSSQLFQEMVESFLEPQIEAMPASLVVPLGVAVQSVFAWLAKRGTFSLARILRGFPHPSGGNGHRVEQFRNNKSALQAQVASWFEKARP
jgi:hypothetical protein